ncbi:10132_t:CDS:1, partial [Ambispora leptoticha]
VYRSLENKQSPPSSIWTFFKCFQIYRSLILHPTRHCYERDEAVKKEFQ